MRAVVVLPTPRTPVRIQACGIRPVSNALVSVRTMAFWPIRSAKVDGRYLRARTRYVAADGVASFIVAFYPAASAGARPQNGRASKDGGSPSPFAARIRSHL